MKGKGYSLQGDCHPLFSLLSVLARTWAAMEAETKSDGDEKTARCQDGEKLHHVRLRYSLNCSFHAIYRG